MSEMGLYNCIVAIMPAQECAFALGDNGEHGIPNPWEPALKCVSLLGMIKEGEDECLVSRRYTIRPAIFPKDEVPVKRILAQQIAAAQEEAGKKKDLSQVQKIAETYLPESSGKILLACRIWVDGGDDNASLRERLARAPEDKRHSGHVPTGASAFQLGDQMVIMCSRRICHSRFWRKMLLGS